MANSKKTETIAEEESAATKKTSEAKKAEDGEKPIIPKQVDPHQYVSVRNGTRGKLIYISPRTGERYVWEEFGDTQEMELQELRNAKAANKKFFERNWFMFDEDFDWVIDYLGVRGFYRHALRVDGFDELFEKKPDEIKTIVKLLSKGQKRTVSYLARQAIADNRIDSRRVIDALEESLGTELIER